MSSGPRFGHGTLPDDTSSRAQRRQNGGPRRATTERVLVQAPGFESVGWTLNVSRGGVRLVLETPLEVGESYSLVFSPLDDGPMIRPGRVVWVRDQQDGQVAGIRFLDSSGSEPPTPT